MTSKKTAAALFVLLACLLGVLGCDNENERLRAEAKQAKDELSRVADDLDRMMRRMIRLGDDLEAVRRERDELEQLVQQLRREPDTTSVGARESFEEIAVQFAQANKEAENVAGLKDQIDKLNAILVEQQETMKEQEGIIDQGKSEIERLNKVIAEQQATIEQQRQTIEQLQQAPQR